MYRKRVGDVDSEKPVVRVDEKSYIHIVHRHLVLTRYWRR